jgi:hypothetical protein
LRQIKETPRRQPYLVVTGISPRLEAKERTMGYAYEHHIPSRAEIVVGMAADAIRRWRDRREFADFVQGCPQEADRLARDLNIDKADLMRLAGAPKGPPVLLNRRLRLLGIDPEHLGRSEPAVTQDLARCCTLCGSKARCAHDLAHRPASTDWRTYCPNEPTIGALGPAAAQSGSAE